MIDAHNVKRSKVKILKAFSPSIARGTGVVPPVPKINNKVNDIPKKSSLLL